MESSKIQQKNNNLNLSARQIWGKIIIKLREKHFVALHIACGDIVDVSFNGETFTINVTEDYIFELLKSEDNFAELKLIFKDFNIEKIDIVKKDKQLPFMEEDIKVLKKVFGDKLIMKQSKTFD